MLAGQSGPFPAQNEPPRSDRVIADNWRGLYGSDPFSSIWPPTAICRIGRPSKRRNSSEYINVCGVSRARMAARDPGRSLPTWTSVWLPNSGIPEFGCAH